MVDMTRPQLQAEMNRLLVNNLVGDIEANELLQILIDFTDSVTFPGPAALPQFRSFSIQGQETVVDAGFGLTGTQTFLYSVSDPSQISGNLTITQAAANLSTAVDPTASEVQLAVNTVVFTAGQEVQFTISGTDTSANPLSRNFTIRAREDDEYLYFGTQVSSDPATFVPLSESRTPISTGQQQITVPVFAGNEFLMIAQPTTEDDFTEIIHGSVNQIGAFTKNDAPFQVNAKDYDAWVSDNALIGSIASGDVITLVR